MIKIWKRIESAENTEKPRKWRHSQSDNVVKVEKFEDETWDAVRNNRLIANFDSSEEAIERARELIE